MGTLARSDFGALSLKERLARKKHVSTDAALLLDISSSMNEDCEPGRTKMQALHQIVDGLTTVPRIIVFGSDAKEVAKDSIPTMGHGMTYMGLAINKCKELGINSAIMITDGDASDKHAALVAASGFKLQIIYVGPGNKPDFLNKLAHACGGGFATQHDIKFTKEITDKVTLLLTPGDKPKGDIQL